MIICCREEQLWRRTGNTMNASTVDEINWDVGFPILQIHGWSLTDFLIEPWICERRKSKNEATPDLKFYKYCLFTDEAGFNLHTQRNHGHPWKGSPEKAIIPTARGVTITILGAISQAGVIDISLKKPQAVAISKKGKTNDAQAMVVSARVGTRTEPFLTYISNVMDLLKEGTLSSNGQCSYTHSSQDMWTIREPRL
jgi:hypothetical protein